MNINPEALTKPQSIKYQFKNLLSFVTNRRLKLSLIMRSTGMGRFSHYNYPMDKSVDLYIKNQNSRTPSWTTLI